MLNTIISSADQKDIDEKILQDRVRILHEHLTTTSIPAVLLCSTIIFASMTGIDTRLSLLAWYAFTLFICAVRIGLQSWYQHSPERARFHLNLFIISTCVSALTWTFAGTLLMSPPDVLHRVLIIVVIAGLTAGGSQTLQASKAANSSFILVSILPLVLWLFSQNETVYLYLSLSVFGYLGFMLVLSQKGYTLLVSSLQLRYENELLLKQILFKHFQLETMNKDLAAEIVKHERAQNRLNYFASHDVLTGLGNRHSFDEKFSQTLMRSQRQEKSFGVLYVDVDKFKNINDNYGHDVGDQILIEVAKRLKQNLRENDTIARIGGDEFIILMEASAAGLQMDQFIQRVYHSFKEPCLINATPYFVTVSMGSCIYPQDGDTKKALLKNADLALYQAKWLGRNRHEAYAEIVKITE